MWHVWGGMRGAYRIWWGDLRERDHLDDPDVDGRVLKWIFKNMVGRHGLNCSGPVEGQVAGACEYCNVICDIFVHCNRSDTRSQQYITHLHTNNTQNNTMKQKHTKHTTVYTMIKKSNQKNMKESDTRKAANFIRSTYLLIMLDTLSLRLSLHFTQLHFTSLQLNVRTP
jgi:hypothetical protein